MTRQETTIQDPVCGTQVSEKHPGATASHEGKLYYFCGPQCKEAFLKNPVRYANSFGSDRAGGCCG